MSQWRIALRVGKSESQIKGASIKLGDMAGWDVAS
jgi:hypothetical protein